MQKSKFHKKKDRKFYRVIKAWLKGKNYSEQTLAIELSSLLTHSLIECFNKPKDLQVTYAKFYHIDEQSFLLNQLISGSITTTALRTEYQRMFGDDIV